MAGSLGTLGLASWLNLPRVQGAAATAITGVPRRDTQFNLHHALQEWERRLKHCYLVLALLS